MRFEELQAIWETQTDRPAFTLNDLGLHLALYQQRDRARRRLFWGSYFPFFIASLFLLGMLALTSLGLYFEQRPGEPTLNVWDVLFTLVAAGTCGYSAVSMYLGRRNHERRQDVVAPSLRQEIDRGIGQLDFELSALTIQARRIEPPVYVGALCLTWEAGRLNGDPTPWFMLLTVLLLVVATAIGSPSARGKKEKELVGRRQALESLRARLDEDSPEDDDSELARS